ncbi:MAG: hypothetical protein KF791_11720 [Verrucomicrobiae bacterium]|nr:hypothetical protein [Verrucomicrobiae bacterium]
MPFRTGSGLILGSGFSPIADPVNVVGEFVFNDNGSSQSGKSLVVKVEEDECGLMLRGGRRAAVGQIRRSVPPAACPGELRHRSNPFGRIVPEIQNPERLGSIVGRHEFSTRNAFESIEEVFPHIGCRRASAANQMFSGASLMRNRRDWLSNGPNAGGEA